MSAAYRHQLALLAVSSPKASDIGIAQKVAISATPATSDESDSAQGIPLTSSVNCKPSYVLASHNMF